MIISIKYRDKIVSRDRDYNFLFRFDIVLRFNENFFAHIVDANVEAMQIRNVFSKIFVISKNLMIEKLKNYDKNDCYLVYLENAHLAITSSLK